MFKFGTFQSLGRFGTSGRTAAALVAGSSTSKLGSLKRVAHVTKNVMMVSSSGNCQLVRANCQDACGDDATCYQSCMQGSGC